MKYDETCRYFVSYPIVLDFPEFGFINFDSDRLSFFIQTAKGRSVGDHHGSTNLPKETINVYRSLLCKG